MHAVRISLLALITAFCGLTYEFTLAQTLSILLGNSVTQYALTIGLFLAGMGVGSIFIERLSSSDDRNHLARLQILLCVGTPLFFGALWLAAIYLPLLVLAPFAYLGVFSVGVVGGAELPLFMRLAGEEKRWSVLSWDYFGMLLATVAFPLWLLPTLGVFATLVWTALLNACVLVALTQTVGARARAGSILLFLVALIYYEENVREWLSQMYIARSL